MQPSKTLHRLIEPSPRITELDRRRQAVLLSGFLLAIIVVAAVVEAITVVTTTAGYTGYRFTIFVVVLLFVIYAISRSEYVEVAALLTVIVMSLGAWVTGLFDLLFIPLWFGGLYMRLRHLLMVMVAEMAIMLALPLFTPDITYSYLLSGPFSFFLMTSVVVIAATHYRNVIESDRRHELAAQERTSRRESARAEALLRVAERLNSQLDLQMLLQAICEETVRALEVPVALMTIYDAQHLRLVPTAGVGFTPEQIRSIPPITKLNYNETIQAFGATFAIADIESHPATSEIAVLREMQACSLSMASIKQGQELIGTLSAISVVQQREFSDEDLLLLQGIADQAALAITNSRLYNDARRRMEHLQSLRSIDQAIVSQRELSRTLDLLLTQITSQLKVDAAVILLMDAEKQMLEYAASRGFHTTTLRHTRLRPGEGMAGRAAAQSKIIHVRNLRAEPQGRIYAPLMAQEEFVTYFAAPLISQEGVNGVLEIFHRSPLEPDDEWKTFLEALAGQASIAIHEATLFEELKRSNAELTEAYESTIEGWTRALDLRDHETEGHTRRVTDLTLELTRAFGFSESEQVHIRHGALLHDIGKMGVPDRILLKEGPLTEEEWEIMRKHPVYAHELLLPITYLRQALDIPYCHHEKWDGSGYPRGLQGQQIPLVARIFAVVDVWDALTSDRPYRAAWSPEKVLAHIKDGAGTHFDPYVVDVFQDLIQMKSGAPSPHDASFQSTRAAGDESPAS